ncbi:MULTISPECIES: alpha/beta fold hydrolase [unclassified Saccharopolyspora]|uniref:alpha/beta fold hydrolase n=1 Tax=unclassified Saccharopolyspora TaxID=2646250 RepID=UPI001CD4E5D3|nr:MULTISPECIES: alpha/beta hydrolase [unclassified Saccharopolyspora]MCA1225494.1 alpha/beta hydrolase [Saccharopolyspora sp. 6M]MCA1278176.1 alpha/beta hydrolase [Saccharopolyspora sp. 7B]
MGDRAEHVQGAVRRFRTSDGRTLHGRELEGPPGAPTVVFEAGAAGTGSTWALVQPAVAEFARAVVYDRSGLGASEPDPVSRTLRRMADDLGSVLDALGPGPFVLVGHSAGGPLIRLAAADRPERVAGLVLVDPSDEASRTLFTPAFRTAEKWVVRINLMLARARLLGPLCRPMVRPLPADARRDLTREGFTPRLVRTQAEQSRTFLDELLAFRAAPPDLGDLPVVVISGGRTGGGMNATVRADANASHAHRAAQSPAGRHVVAELSGHQVPIAEPDVVVREIRRLLG